METKVVVGDITRIKSDAIMLNFFEGMKSPESDTAFDFISVVLPFTELEILSDVDIPCAPFDLRLNYLRLTPRYETSKLTNSNGFYPYTETWT